MDVKALVQRSLAEAKAEQVDGGTKQLLHRNRSQAWVRKLAGNLKQHFSSDEQVLVFSKQDYSHRRDFGLNELLHDIVVCRVGKTKSARHRKELHYIQDVLWQIESEFARDSRQALIDFSKLVLGSAHNKLFVGPRVNDTAAFLNVLRPAAQACQGTVYTALIPHPSDWGINTNSIQVWEFNGQHWSPL